MRGRGENRVIGKRLEKSDLIEPLSRTTQSRKLKPYIGAAQLVLSMRISYKAMVQQGLTHRENV